MGRAHLIGGLRQKGSMSQKDRDIAELWSKCRRPSVQFQECKRKAGGWRSGSCQLAQQINSCFENLRTWTTWSTQDEGEVTPKSCPLASWNVYSCSNTTVIVTRNIDCHNIKPFHLLEKGSSVQGSTVR